jgi:hypothetical protein
MLKRDNKVKFNYTLFNDVNATQEIYKNVEFDLRELVKYD